MAEAARPHLVVAVAGTGTEVGKTFVGVALIDALRADGWYVSARKPAQSFDLDDDAPHDGDLLAAATGEERSVVCPPHRNYPTAMAPPMAADALGLPAFTTARLAGEVAGSWPARRGDIGLVELAGGVASPMTADGDGTALCVALDVDLTIVVADAGLGTINSVRLTVAALLEAELSHVVVHLNRFDADDDLHRRNASWLRDVDGVELTTDVGELSSTVAARVPRHCPGCGRPTTDCDGSCRRPLDPDRYCDRCGRQMVVLIVPTGHQARCKVHGPRPT